MKGLCKDKRGIWDNLSAMAMGILTFIIIGAVGALIISGFASNLPATQVGCAALYQLNGTANCLLTSNVSQPAIATILVADSNATAITAYGHTGIASAASWTPVVVIVAVGAVLVALVAGYFIRNK